MCSACLTQRASGTTVSVPAQLAGLAPEPVAQLVDRQGRPVGLDLGVHDLAAARLPVGIDPGDRRRSSPPPRAPGRCRGPRPATRACGAIRSRADQPWAASIGARRPRRRGDRRAPRTAPRPRAPPPGTPSHRDTCRHGTDATRARRGRAIIGDDMVATKSQGIYPSELSRPRRRTDPAGGGRGARTPEPEPPRTGVVFVHGIGSQQPAETLLQWSAPIIEVLTAWHGQFPQDPADPNPRDPVRRATSTSRARSRRSRCGTGRDDRRRACPPRDRVAPDRGVVGIEGRTARAQHDHELARTAAAAPPRSSMGSSATGPRAGS